MCGRFCLWTPNPELAKRFNAKIDLSLEPHYNAAPGQDLAVILNEEPGKIVLARWGLVPEWAKDDKTGYRMINARSETIQETKSYKTLFQEKRCIIPADGFYEWKEKKPYLITVKGGTFAMAGIWNRWKDPKGGEITTFSIITTPANPLVKQLHDRMPAILNRKDEREWLKQPLSSLLTPYPPELMKAVRVSDKVNSAKNEGKELVEEIPE